MKSLLNISLTSVCGEQLQAVAGTKETVMLARIYGEATDIKRKSFRSGGDSETIMGDFRAVNLATGEEFKSAIVYLPRGLQEQVAVALDGGSALVQFAFDIWAEPDTRQPREGEDYKPSYNIGFRDLLEDEGGEDEIAKAFAGKLPPLPKIGKAK